MKKLRLLYNGNGTMPGYVTRFAEIMPSTSIYGGGENTAIFALAHRMKNGVVIASQLSTCKDMLGGVYLRTLRGKAYGSSKNKSLLIFFGSTNQKGNELTRKAVINGHMFLNRVEEFMGAAKSYLYEVDCAPYYEYYEKKLPKKMPVAYCVTLNRKWSSSLPAFHLAIAFLRMGSIRNLANYSVPDALSLKSAVRSVFKNHSSDMSVFRTYKADILFFLKNFDRINKNMKYKGSSGQAGIRNLLDALNGAQLREQQIKIMSERIKYLKRKEKSTNKGASNS